MKKFYISNFEGASGISKYSRDFYHLILEPGGYIFINSSESLPTILSQASSFDQIHIEIGIFQKKEIEILLAMMRAKYKNVSVTLHDAPLIKYPFYEFKNSFINSISKMVDKYGGGLGNSKALAKKIKAIYVLSRRGVEMVKKRYGTENVYYLPHLINQLEIKRNNPANINFIYFGFIGKNKGIEYALRLHREINKLIGPIHFYVVGTPIGKEKIFYETIKRKYAENVHYLGYVPEEKLDEVFARASFALIPFKDYEFFCPASASVLFSLIKGKIVFTSNVNALNEWIEDGKNGFFLSGDIKKDASNILAIIQDSHKIDQMQDEIFEYLLSNHSANQVKKQYKM